MISYKEKLNNVNTFIFDMDGVLTTGTAYIFKDEVMRNLFSKDGYAIQYAAKMGYKIFIISGGHSQQMKTKFLSLGMKDVILDASNKVKAFYQLESEHKLKIENCLFMGDDIPDLKLLEIIGVSTCPHDAAPELRMMVDYVSTREGGQGCVRDVIEQTMKVRGDWMKPEAFEW
jgi:3-deoxy-D-manno-octulosonate 8-phosphate phosphatase (KDO 8-P phosphatase)